MSKTAPDFNSNEDEDFEDEHTASPVQLNLGNRKKRTRNGDEFSLNDDEEDDDDDEIAKLRAEHNRITAQAEQLKELQDAISKANASPVDSDVPNLGGSSTASPSSRSREISLDPEEADARSIFAKNVDYSSTDSELTTFFSSCGAVARVTILKNKMNLRPKGCAYVQFKSKEAVEAAIAMDGTSFKGRALSISRKHATTPGFKMRRRRRRRRRFNPYYSYGYGYAPYYPRRRRRWSPY